MRRQTLLEQRTIYPTAAIAAEAYLSDCHIRQIAPRTVEFYREKLARFIAFSEAQQAVSLEQITPDHLRRFFLWLEQNGNNAGGRHAYYRALRAFFNWLETEYDGYASPLRKLKPPKVDAPPIEGVSAAAVQAMLAACDKSFTGVRDKAILLILLDTGARASETLNLNWQDIDLAAGTLLIRKGKNGKPRMAFLGRTARQALRQYARLRQDDNPAVFVTIHGERLTYAGIRQILRRIAAKAGLTDIPSPHDFRRACALTLLRNGADVVSVSRLLGHASLEVTKRYLAQTADDLRQAHHRHSPADNLKQPNHRTGNSHRKE